MRVVCVGDSITAGQHTKKGWPGMLTDLDVVAKGVNGDTTRLMLERFPADVQEQQADVVIIQGGHNDCNRWQTDRGLNRVSPDAFAANLLEMVCRCRAFGATPMVCTMTPTSRDVDYADDVAFYNSILISVCCRNDVQMIDVRDAVGSHPLDEMLLSDGVHLTKAGHEAYAGAVQEALIRLLTHAVAA